MFTDEKTKHKRRAICMDCPHSRNSFKLLGFTIFKRTPQCKICHCLIEAKTMFEDAKCPKKKW